MEDASGAVGGPTAGGVGGVGGVISHPYTVLFYLFSGGFGGVDPHPVSSYQSYVSILDVLYSAETPDPPRS